MNEFNHLFMKIMFEDKNIKNVEDIVNFLENSELLDLEIESSVVERANWIRDVLFRLKYNKLNKKGKRIIRAYLIKITKLKNRSIKYHITAYKQNKLLAQKYKRTKFATKYTVTTH